MSLTNSETEKSQNIKYIGSDLQVCEISEGIYETAVIDIVLPSFVTIMIDNIRLKTSLKITPISEALRFDRKSIFHSILGFTKLEGNPRNTYFNEKLRNESGTDKTHWSCGCIRYSIIKAEREPIFYSFSLDNPIGHKKLKAY